MTVRTGRKGRQSPFVSFSDSPFGGCGMSVRRRALSANTEPGIPDGRTLSGVPAREVASRLGALALVSAIAGVLMAGMLLPVVGGGGLVARAGANEFERLPTALQESPLPH